MNTSIELLSCKDTLHKNTFNNKPAKYLKRISRRSTPVERNWSTSCREVLVVFSLEHLPLRRLGHRCPRFPEVVPRLWVCQPGSSRQEYLLLPVAQALRPAVLESNSRGRRLNQEGSRRPRDLCHGPGYLDPRWYRYLRDYTASYV